MGSGCARFSAQSPKEAPPQAPPAVSTTTSPATSPPPPVDDPVPVDPSPVPTVLKTTDMLPPVANAGVRVTKKPFGIYISPQDSPVSPERFLGYHTATDFETFPDEQNVDVPVSAICSGKLLRAGMASGYGGYAVQACTMQGQDVTVVYGHVRTSSVTVKVGGMLEAGQRLGVLGRGYSDETDNERKHLHLGIHRGTGVNIRGYISTQAALADWMDAGALLGIR